LRRDLAKCFRQPAAIGSHSSATAAGANRNSCYFEALPLNPMSGTWFPSPKISPKIKNEDQNEDPNEDQHTEVDPLPAPFVCQRTSEEQQGLS
jgi:hypothetical protein